MNPLFRSPRRDMLTLRETMNRLIDDEFFGRDGERERLARLPIDVYSTDDEIVVSAAIPGIDPDDVNITVEGDTLVISGETSPLIGNVEWSIIERFHGKFTRSLTLNVPVDHEKIEATFENGLLTLVLPKTEAIKPKKIEVKSK
jgi:HSP20 family protein